MINLRISQPRIHLLCRKFTFSAFFLACIFLLFSCKDASQPSNTTDSQAIPHVQAVIKILDTEFNPLYKDSISGVYQNKTSLKVPKNLMGQNKWFMFEGPVIENDVIAYRYYADGRHRFDIYGKSVSNLVMDTVGWHYHDIMNWGSDILKVGEALGIGSPAIYLADSLYTFSEWSDKQIDLTFSGADSVCIRTTFYSLKIGENELDLVQDWSMISGSPWSRISLKVIKGTLPENALFATGFIKHLTDLNQLDVNQKHIFYNYGPQSYHKQNLGMAIAVNQELDVHTIENSLSHVIVANKSTDDFQYQFMATWAEGNQQIKSITEFERYLKK